MNLAMVTCEVQSATWSCGGCKAGRGAAWGWSADLANEGNKTGLPAGPRLVIVATARYFASPL